MAAVNFNKMDEFRYNRYGQVQTGFDNSIDHSMFGHWRNPEYQELCQEAEMIEREKQEMNEQPKDNKSTDDVDWLPF